MVLLFNNNVGGNMLASAFLNKYALILVINVNEWMHIESVFMSGGYNAEHRSNEAKIIFMLALRRKIIPQTAKTKVKAKATGERIYIYGMRVQAV